MFAGRVDKVRWGTLAAIAAMMALAVGCSEAEVRTVEDPVEHSRMLVEAHLPYLDDVMIQAARRQALRLAMAERIEDEAARPFLARVEDGLRYSTVFQREYVDGDLPATFVDEWGLSARGDEVQAVLEDAWRHGLETETLHAEEIKAGRQLLFEMGESSRATEQFSPTAREVEALVEFVASEIDGGDATGANVLIQAVSVVDEVDNGPVELRRFREFARREVESFADRARVMAELELWVADAALRYAREMGHKNLNRLDWRQLRDAGGSTEVILSRMQQTLRDLVTAGPGQVEEVFRQIEPSHPQYRALLEATDRYRSLEDRQDQVARMELTLQRWRESHLEGDEDYILVNIPSFHAEVWADGRKRMSFEVVVGKSNRQCDPETGRWEYPDATPIVMSELDYIMFNPPWYVPNRLAREVLRPRQEKNPDYFEENGYEEIELPDGRRAIKQLPGPDNALGLAKFIFPNEHNVYLHDTPHKEYFEYDRRAYSHGCVRVSKPLELAEFLLGWEGRDDLNVQDLLDTERIIRIDFERQLPVMIEYYTVWVDDDGEPVFYDDLYRRDARRLSDDPDRFGRCRPARRAPVVEPLGEDLGP